MIKKLKKWWFSITHVKCDYCKEPVEYYYEAYMFPIATDEYRGNCICIGCIKRLKDQNSIIYTKNK